MITVRAPGAVREVEGDARAVYARADHGTS
jgi:hypothetical protein